MKLHIALLLAILVSAETGLVFRMRRADEIALHRAIEEAPPGPGYRAPLMRLARRSSEARTLDRIAPIIARIGTTEERIEVLRRLVELEPGSGERKISLALVLAEAGRHDDAEPLFQDALEPAP
ncbi:MAG: hypothetical protein CME06_08810 [Gemmatimonadetes bacterium]|nr:hypothetical protein [Gemmatimonadota bacterium]